MAVLKVDSDVLPQTVRLLLQLAASPDDVQFTHGADGNEVHVPDELALAFVTAVQQIDDMPVEPSPNGHTPQSTPSKKAKR